MRAFMERRAGQNAGEERRRLARRGLAWCAAGLILPACAWVLGAPWWLVSVAWVVSIAGTLTTERVLLPQVERWGRGEQGEQAVGALLDSLAGSGWRVLHDISFGRRGNIDHVLIGPGGIFTVETKSHGGRIDADRVDPRMLRQAYAQCKLLETVTQRDVEPLLVFSRAYLTPAVSRRRGVVVLPARMLEGHLKRRTRLLAASEVDRVHALLQSAIPREARAAHTPR